DPGRGRQQCGDAIEFGLEPLRLGCAEPFQVGDAVGPRRRLDLLDPGDFRFAGGDYQLAELRVWHAVLAAIGVEPLAPLDAAPVLEAAGRIIEAAMDHLAVARGGLETDRVGAFEDDDLMARERQCPRDRQADHPGADDDRFDLVHRSPLAWNRADAYAMTAA